VPWTDRQLIFAPTGQAPWIGTHAALPVVQSVNDRQRLLLSSRDAQGRSHIGCVELSLDQPGEILTIGQRPLLSPGALGTFDDSGVTSSCVVERGDHTYLYYTGWSLGVSVPFYLNIGLALSVDGGRSFERVSQAPLLGCSAVDPYLTASPWILVENGTWRMWYVSGTGWSAAPGGARHHYHIKYAESTDGFDWTRRGVVCIDYQSADEHAFGRPCVLHDAGRYRMWYPYRGERYRIGYAESDDGIRWQRLDQKDGLDVSEAGWDSEMVAYPLVLRHRGRLSMLYNGNGYGRSGVGLARSA
jgi:hypothetical protein